MSKTVVLLSREMPPRDEIFNTEGTQGPLETIYARVINEDQPCAVSNRSGSDGHGDCRLMAFDGLNHA